MNKTSNNNQIAIDKSTNLVYNTDMTNNNTINEREIKMTLTPNELLAMVNSLNERPMPNMQEDNWEELESDDGHLELYLDGIDE